MQWGDKGDKKAKKFFITRVVGLECESCGATWKNTNELLNEITQTAVKEIRAGNLPIVILAPHQITFIERKNEIIRMYNSGVTLYEQRTRSYSYRPRSVGTSIRLTKGVWIRPRIGGGTVTQKEEVMKPLDTGDLFLTNQRFIFVGSKRNVNVPLKKIISVKAGDSMIYVARERKTRLEAFEVPRLKVEIWKAAIETAVQQAS